MEEGKRVVVAILPVFGKATAAIEPADGTLDEPALRFNDEAFGVVATFDDLDRQEGHDAADGVVEDWPRIGAVGE